MISFIVVQVQIQKDRNYVPARCLPLIGPPIDDYHFTTSLSLFFRSP